MKCPLLVSGWWSKEPGFKTSKTDCLQDECTWWDKHHKACAVLSIFDALNHSLYYLKDIEAKMPSGQSFVK